MSAYLVSYKPLTLYPQGRIAVERHTIPPFVDYSCRREPDFEALFPSISALCRKDKFAPRLREEDTVIYITCKGSYLGLQIGHWRLVAILKVLKRFESHGEAGEWYLNQVGKVPSNCMISGNPPLDLDMTAPVSEHKKDIGRWNAAYMLRARSCGVFLACISEFLELYDPPVITEETMYHIFGRIPGTRNPPMISQKHLENLKRACGVKE